MCGITGIVSRTGNIEPDMLLRMTRCLSHRGPDDEGTYLDQAGGVGLGFRRLSIIDLSALGHQPMQDVNKNAWLVFNGEIYNFLEVRKTLESKGYAFRSHTDSEVLLNAYLEWGTECLNVLNGMFAFAIWDLRKRELFIARDRFGIKPIFYTAANGMFAFASEIKALLQLPHVSRDLNMQAVWNYLSFLQIPAPDTIYSSIRKLLPAHAMIVKEDAEPKIWCYWDFPVARSPMHEEEAVATVRHLLEKSVERHLIADVPVGVFLSGGIDSSAVVALASMSSSEPVKTFSVSFSNDKEYDESPYQRMVVDKYRTAHTEFQVAPDILEASHVILKESDEPFAISSAIPLYYISKLASQSVKVVLSGDGGDELFFGYEPRYRRALFLNSVQLLSPPVSASLIRMLSSFPEALQHKPIVRHLGKVLEFGTSNPKEGYLNSFGIFSLRQKKEILHPAVLKKMTNGFGEHYDAMMAQSPSDFLEYCAFMDTRATLADDMLIKFDRCTSAVSIEGRVPLLDKEIAEFALRLPPKLNYSGTTGKRILRKAVADLLPKEVLAGRKKGFNVPLHQWMTNNMPLVRDHLVYNALPEMKDLFRGDAIETLLRVHERHNPRFGHHIWALLQLQEWFSIQKNPSFVNIHWRGQSSPSKIVSL